MIIALLTALSALLIVSGLIYVLRQLMNAWCEPEHHQTGNTVLRTASELSPPNS